MYLSKANVLMCLEEWQKLILTAEECLRIHESDISDEAAAMMYNIQGSAYRNLKEYKSAIRSYEYALARYNKVGDLGAQGNILCCMAICYDNLEKTSLASTFYEKGFAKYLSFFGMTRSSLLKKEFVVTDSGMKTEIDRFSVHLYGMALHEQDNGDKMASKDFLKMSANCGNSQAKSEYKRIYGY